MGKKQTSKKGCILITGAAKRLGRAIALGLASDGWDIGVHFNQSKKDAQTTVDEIRALGVKAQAIFCDLSSPNAGRLLIDECVNTLGPVHCLVNNASLFTFDTAKNFTSESLRQNLSVNLVSPLVLAKTFADQIPDTEVGCVINLLDQKVFNLNADFFSYTVSKVALEGATRLMALALAPKVRVCGLAPGITLPSGPQTNEGFMSAHKMAPLGKSSTPDDIVGGVKYLIGASSLTGTTIILDGGQHLWPSKRDVQFEV